MTIQWPTNLKTKTILRTKKQRGALKLEKLVWFGVEFGVHARSQIRKNASQVEGEFSFHDAEAVLDFWTGI